MTRFVNCSECGEYKPYYAKGLCKKCYMIIGNYNTFGNRKYRIKIGDYYAIYKPHFKFCYKPKGYVLEHRYIMYIYLSILNNKVTYIEGSDVHHINENQLDNRIQNLQLLTRLEHKQKHIIDKSDRFCNLCGSNETKHWHNDINGFLCKFCYTMIIYYINKLFGDKYNRICNMCKTDKTGRWHKDTDGFLCHSCYDMIYRLRICNYK